MISSMINPAFIVFLTLQFPLVFLSVAGKCGRKLLLFYHHPKVLASYNWLATNFPSVLSFLR
jgi:hypothetical protein